VNPIVNEPDTTFNRLTRTQLAALQAVVIVVALCGIVYELIIAAISSYLLGDSVVQFSITIGLFMFAMGMGSLGTRLLRTNLVERFLCIEMSVALVGGFSAAVLFGVFPYTSLYRPVQYMLIVIIGILVGLEIPVLTRIMTEVDGLRKSLANVLALDYFGALVGSVAFPLILLPFLGLFRASFAIGLLNALVVLVTVTMFGSVMRRPRRWIALSIASVALLTAGMFASPALMRFSESRLYGDPIVVHKQSSYQRIVVTRDEVTGRHRLYLDGHLQFAEGDEYRYHESLVHPVMSMPGPRRRVLILGGGDGLAVREVLRWDGVERIDLVDIDPAVTRLSRRFAPIARLNESSLENPRVTLHHEDAFAFLRRIDTLFDRIVIDLPDPHNEALAKLYSVEFYRLLRRRLAPDGAFVTQASSPWATRQAYWSIAATIEAADMAPLSYRIAMPSFGVWGFHLARADGSRPLAFDIPETTRYLTDEIMRCATTFPRDETPMDVPVNSMFDPKLYMLYLRDMNP
jgi:spermidine synthase